MGANLHLTMMIKEHCPCWFSDKSQAGNLTWGFVVFVSCLKFDEFFCYENLNGNVTLCRYAVSTELRNCKRSGSYCAWDWCCPSHHSDHRRRPLHWYYPKPNFSGINLDLCWFWLHRILEWAGGNCECRSRRGWTAKACATWNESNKDCSQRHCPCCKVSGASHRKSHLSVLWSRDVKKNVDLNADCKKSDWRDHCICHHVLCC